MKKFLLAALVFFSCFAGYAQSELLVQSNEKGLYLNHTVSPKENFYSIGRMYALSPRDIAAFNALDMNDGLSIGQVVKIPLNITNFSQETKVGTPVYYVVGDKEGLYRVSLKNNKVLMVNLRKWNNLKSDAVAAGQKLVVGYLITPNVAATTAPPAAVRTSADEPVAKTETPAQRRSEAAVNNTDTKPAASGVTATPQVATGGAGYFKTQFDAQSKNTTASKEQTVTAGIFKTASGWQDGKYYALIDNVDPGTIIRVVNPSNNKSVYAKVLGEMSGIRQNQGLEVRISNAAASALEIAEQDKFVLKVNH